MKARILDVQALRSVSPDALTAYVVSEGWQKQEVFGGHSDVYYSNDRPEIILPRSSSLADYPQVVSDLLRRISDVVQLSELALYRDIVTANRDVIRVRAKAHADDGTVLIPDGVKLINSAQEMILSAACSVKEPKSVYRAGGNKEATDYVGRVRLGQTEHGSFIITLLTPVIPPPIGEQTIIEFEGVKNTEDYDKAPIERKVTLRLASALKAVKEATERTASGSPRAFEATVLEGVSANLCDSLIGLVEPFGALDIGFSWARTRPTHIRREVIQFSDNDVPILREASRVFRSKEPQNDVELHGFIGVLKRGEEETDGTVTMRTTVEDRTQSVSVKLSQNDYHKAVQAHDKKAAVTLVGDLERKGQCWHLLNPTIKVIVEPEEDGDA